MFAVVFEDRPRLVSDFGMVIYPLSISLPLKREGGAVDAEWNILPPLLRVLLRQHEYEEFGGWREESHT